MKEKKTYISPVCETIEIGNTVIMAGSPETTNISIKTSSDGDDSSSPSINYGGDTKSSEEYSPW